MQKYLSHLLITMIATALLAIPATLSAQDDEPEGHIFAISTFKVSFEDLEGLYEMWEEDMDLVKDNEYILSQKILTHQWGPDWSIMIISEHATFAEVDAAQKRTTELFEAKYKKEKDRDARNAAFAKYHLRDGHSDAIVQENLKLTK